MKTFNKTIGKMFKHNIGRFVANVLIVLFSIALIGGLGVLPYSFVDSFLVTYKEGNCPDIILKNVEGSGFFDEDLEKVREIEDVVQVDKFFMADFKIQGNIYRFYIGDMRNLDIGKLTLKEGDYPEKRELTFETMEGVVEEKNLNRRSYEVGQQVTLKDFSMGGFVLGDLKITITGIVSNSMYNTVQRENAQMQDENGNVVEDEYVDYILYLDRENLPLLYQYLMIDTDIYVKLSSKYDYYSKDYDDYVQGKIQELESLFEEDMVKGLSLNENVAYALYDNYTQKIRNISYFFPIFFFAVCALVNLIIITRLIKDERSILATYLSLGVPKSRVVFKYMLFSFLSVALGCLLGLLIGVPILPAVVLPAYNAVFKMNGYFFSLKGVSIGIYSSIAILVISLAVSLGSVLSYLRESPAVLMQAKAPKAGKKILMERIPFLWKPLPFSFKSSIRNIFRQKKNLVLTSLSVIGSVVLVLLGIGLFDVSESLVHDELFGNVASSMGLISMVVVLFAVSITIVIIYSLVNMNISERGRELATLKVLGYHDIECSLYTFREVMITSAISALIGLPIAAFVAAFAFRYIGFGDIKDVKWTSYLLTYLLVVLTTAIVNVILYPKVKAVNMNDSLKVLD